MNARTSLRAGGVAASLFVVAALATTPELHQMHASGFGLAVALLLALWGAFSIYEDTTRRLSEYYKRDGLRLYRYWPSVGDEVLVGSPMAGQHIGQVLQVDDDPEFPARWIKVAVDGMYGRRVSWISSGDVEHPVRLGHNAGRVSPLGRAS